MVGLKKVLKFTVHVVLVMGLLWLFNIEAANAEINHIKVTKLFLQVEGAVGNNTPHFRIRDREVDGYLTMGYEAEVTKYAYTKTVVRSMFTSAQFREVTLDMEFGIRPLKGIDVFVAHTSEHTLDRRGYRNFPQKNTVGIRFNYIGD